MSAGLLDHRRQLSAHAGAPPGSLRYRVFAGLSARSLPGGRRLPHWGTPRIPQDISVIGLDNLLVSRYIDPPLSTVTFDKEQLGMRAVEVLYQIINGEPYEPITLLPTTLVERSTVLDLRK